MDTTLEWVHVMIHRIYAAAYLMHSGIHMKLRKDADNCRSLLYSIVHSYLVDPPNNAHQAWVCNVVLIVFIRVAN